MLLSLLLLVLMACSVFIPGLNWGLPSRAADPFLFDDHPVWSGARIQELAGPTDDPTRGADVASETLAARDHPIVVNETDRQRAKIIRRYRLMSHQPDEWNTLKALSEMKPGRGDFDPKLYQYGGLWVYPVGAMLKSCGVAGLITVRSDVTYYLDHPEAIGGFYVVARAYSVLWGLVGVVVVYLLVRRICCNGVAAAVAAACFMLMPVVVNAAHEAKPHLAGTVLMLLAVLLASRYAMSGSWRAALAAGALCGAALGMVLSALPVFLILPMMAVLRPGPWRIRWRMTIAATIVGAGVYAVTNPYPWLNQFSREGRAVVRSNLGTSAGMYRADWTGRGLPNAALLLGEGMSFVLLAAGAVGVIALGWRAVRVRKDSSPDERRRRSTGILLSVPAIWVAIQFALLATGKPAEYARFALYLDVALLIEAVVAAQTFLRPPVRCIVLASLIGTTGWSGLLYTAGFVRDSSTATTRLAAARRVQAMRPRTVAVEFEPAPWSFPPVDLFGCRLILLPRGRQDGDGAGVLVRPVDLPLDGRNPILRLITSTPISWASKPFEVKANPGMVD